MCFQRMPAAASYCPHLHEEYMMNNSYCTSCTCRSVHAHIVLWVHPEDVDRVASEITGCIPAEQDAQGNWVTHSEAQKRLLDIVLRKQIHRCTDVGKVRVCLQDCVRSQNSHYTECLGQDSANF